MARASNVSQQTLRLLEELVKSPRSRHYGYALSQSTGLKSGTLYPILVRLAEQGWLDTQWEVSEEPGRPPRHTYRLTSDGAKAARQRLAGSGGSPRMARPRLASTEG